MDNLYTLSYTCLHQGAGKSSDDPFFKARLSSQFDFVYILFENQLSIFSPDTKVVKATNNPTLLTPLDLVVSSEASHGKDQIFILYDNMGLNHQPCLIVHYEVGSDGEAHLVRQVPYTFKSEGKLVGGELFKSLEAYLTYKTIMNFPGGAFILSQDGSYLYYASELGLKRYHTLQKDDEKDVDFPDWPLKTVSAMAISPDQRYLYLQGKKKEITIEGVNKLFGNGDAGIQKIQQLAESNVLICWDLQESQVAYEIPFKGADIGFREMYVSKDGKKIYAMPTGLSMTIRSVNSLIVLNLEDKSISYIGSNPAGGLEMRQHFREGLSDLPMRLTQGGMPMLHLMDDHQIILPGEIIYIFNTQTESLAKRMASPPGSDGILFMWQRKGHYLGIGANGSIWQFHTGKQKMAYSSTHISTHKDDIITERPLIVPDENLLVVLAGKSIIGYEMDGLRAKEDGRRYMPFRWKKEVEEGSMPQNLLISEDVAYCTAGKKIFAFQLHDGSLAGPDWAHFEAENELLRPVLSGDHAYAVDVKGNIYVLSRLKGQLQKHFSLISGTVDTAPTTDGRSLFVVIGGILLVIDLESQQERWRLNLQAPHWQYACQPFSRMWDPISSEFFDMPKLKDPHDPVEGMTVSLFSPLHVTGSGLCFALKCEMKVNIVVGKNKDGTNEYADKPYGVQTLWLQLNTGDPAEGGGQITALWVDPGFKTTPYAYFAYGYPIKPYQLISDAQSRSLFYIPGSFREWLPGPQNKPYSGGHLLIYIQQAETLNEPDAMFQSYLELAQAYEQMWENQQKDHPQDTQIANAKTNWEQSLTRLKSVEKTASKALEGMHDSLPTDPYKRAIKMQEARSILQNQYINKGNKPLPSTELGADGSISFPPTRVGGIGRWYDDVFSAFTAQYYGERLFADILNFPTAIKRALRKGREQKDLLMNHSLPTDGNFVIAASTLSSENNTFQRFGDVLLMAMKEKTTIQNDWYVDMCVTAPPVVNHINKDVYLFGVDGYGMNKIIQIKNLDD